jgi:signal transduction histidine kinase
MVRDTGIGIAEADLDHIFEPFFSRKPDGTGLGLATTARIVEDHKGSIEVKSQLGRGTIFTIRLPAVLMP